MPTQLYEICQIIFPELAGLPYPNVMDDFHQFIEWVNTKRSNIQYVELKEYYDNGIIECYQLKKANIDTEQLNQYIEDDMNSLFKKYDENDQNNNWNNDPYEQTENTIFGHILAVAELHLLALLVISNENPYWMLVPNRTEQINHLIEAFNQTFTDVKLYHYI